MAEELDELGDPLMAEELDEVGDPSMAEELDKVENRREVNDALMANKNRILNRN
jgi:hypothetical protein